MDIRWLLLPLFYSHVSTSSAFSIILAFHRSCVSTSDILSTMHLRHRGFPQNFISIVQNLLCCRPVSPPPLSPPYRISITALPIAPHLHRHARPPPSSPLLLSAICIIPHLHCLRCHPPAFLFQSLSQCLPLSCVFHHRLSLCSFVSDVSPPPLFISSPNIFCCRPHITRHIFCHWRCPTCICRRHSCSAFTVPCVLLPFPFIVCCNRLKPLLSPPPCTTSAINLIFHSYFSALIFLLLFDILVMHYFLCSSLIFSLWSDILNLLFSSLLAPLFLIRSSLLRNCFSALICRVFLHFPSLWSSTLQSNMIIPLTYVRSTMIYLIIIFFDLSDLNYTAQIVADWIRSVWLSLLRYDLSFTPLDLLIYLKVTYHFITYHLILACIIT